MKRLQDKLSKENIDFALIVTNEDVNPNLFYLTRYSGSGALIVFPNSKSILHVTSRDLNEAKLVDNVKISHGKKLFEILISLNPKRIGIDFSNVSVRDFNNIRDKINCEFVDLSDFFNEVRAIKTETEISLVKKACKITDAILENFVKNFGSFDTEESAVAFLVYETYKSGCTLSFEPIVASGKNAAIPHHKSGGKMNKGFCVVDFGVKYKGYCSDVARTFYFGDVSNKEKKIYYDLLHAQEKAISLLKSGISISELGNSIDKTLKQTLIHALGHGLGVEVHESPYILNSSKGILKENMIITIEPGEYIEGKYGIRIEDDILVTKDGCEVLSKFSKELISV
jgi:Xaa-Pro aminopeptidase